MNITELIENINARFPDNDLEYLYTKQKEFARCFGFLMTKEHGKVWEIRNTLTNNILWSSENATQAEAIDQLFSLCLRAQKGESTDRETGMITNFNYKQHFGYIRSEKGVKYFFSISDVKKKDLKSIKSGAEVSFLPSKDNGKHNRAKLINFL